MYIYIYICIHIQYTCMHTWDGDGGKQRSGEIWRDVGGETGRSQACRALNNNDNNDNDIDHHTYNCIDNNDTNNHDNTNHDDNATDNVNDINSSNNNNTFNDHMNKHIIWFRV